MNRRLGLKCIGFAPCLLVALLSARPALADFATHAKQPGTMPGDTLVTGGRHTCVVETDGELWCWGKNNRGQLGDGGIKNTNKPYATGPTLKDVVSAAGGGLHTCAIKRDGSVWCWGNNENGEVGDGSLPGGKVLTPTLVIGPGKPVDSQISARAISLAWSSSCVLLRNGKVACWGYGAYGQTGLDKFKDTNHPELQPSAENHDIIDISMSASHGCSVRADGTAWSWGHDGFEQLGDGPSPPSSMQNNPVQVVGISRAIAISAGIHHGCVLERPGTMKCWGYNSNGEVGDGTTQMRPSPVPVVGLPAPATSINAAPASTCARLADGTLACWGQNAYGELGQGNFDDRHSPVLVPGLAGVAQPSVGSEALHRCVSHAGGDVRCWGHGLEGQIGDGTNTDSPTPTLASGLGDTVSLAATGALHNCALRADGTVWCWGNNAKGQLGNGTTSASSVPVKVQVTVGPEQLFVAVTTGYQHSCAVTAGLGQVYCWGSNGNGQLGDNTKNDRLLPVQVLDAAGLVPLQGAVIVQAGAAHSCALLSNGGAKCWGNNSYGQLGDGSVSASLVACRRSRRSA